MLEIVQTYWLYFLIGQYPNGPLGGLALTLILAACGLVLALPLGIAFGLARVSPWRWLRWPVTAFVFVVRGVPLLMVVFWAYFFLPSVTGVKTDQFATMLIACAADPPPPWATAVDCCTTGGRTPPHPPTHM